MKLDCSGQVEDNPDKDSSRKFQCLKIGSTWFGENIISGTFAWEQGLFKKISIQTLYSFGKLIGTPATQNSFSFATNYYFLLIQNHFFQGLFSSVEIGFDFQNSYPNAQLKVKSNMRFIMGGLGLQFRLSKRILMQGKIGLGYSNGRRYYQWNETNNNFDYLGIHGPLLVGEATGLIGINF